MNPWQQAKHVSCSLAHSRLEEMFFFYFSSDFFAGGWGGETSASMVPHRGLKNELRGC